MEKKNTKAIEKIITELSKRDYESRCKKLTKSQIDNIRQGKKILSDYGGYSLSQETMEAIETKKGRYKSYCVTKCPKFDPDEYIGGKGRCTQRNIEINAHECNENYTSR